MKRVSALLIASGLLAVSSSSVDAAKVESRHGCVNLRTEPSIDATVISCLQPGTNIEPYRLPPSGRLVWQEDERDRRWYYITLSGTKEKGWLIPACTNILGDGKQSTCTDNGTASQQKSQTLKSQTLAQNDFTEEVLQNTSWQVVPGAAAGRNAIDTRIDVNHIIRNNNAITFDITGYQGFYHRLQGDCKTRQVRIIRRGLQGSGGDVLSGESFNVSYRLVDASEPAQIFKFHQISLDFACKQTNNQVARTQPVRTQPTNSKPISTQPINAQVTDTPTANAQRVTPIDLNGTWKVTSPQILYHARNAGLFSGGGCFSGTGGSNLSLDPTPIEFVIAHHQDGSFSMPPLAAYTTISGARGQSSAISGKLSGNQLAFVYQSNAFTLRNTATVSDDGNTISGETICTAEKFGLSQAKFQFTWVRVASKPVCEEPIANAKPGLSRWWATAADKNEPVISVIWTVEIPKEAGEGQYTLNIIPEGANAWKLSGKNNGKPAVTINSSKKTRDFERTTLRNYTVSLGCLKPGKHQLKIEGFQVPDKPVIERITFELEGKSSPKPLKALFIADHPEPKNATSYQELIRKYAPILYFDNGFIQSESGVGTAGEERYRTTVSAEETSWKERPNDMQQGDSESVIDLSKYSTGTYISSTSENVAGAKRVPSKIYATVISKNGETAINYYFHYLRSNWAEHGGCNTHEADWEGITVFLKGESPDRVAFAQHVNVGFIPATRATYSASGGQTVLWNAAELEGDRPKVYVGLGGHASYPYANITNFRSNIPGLSLKQFPEYHRGNLSQQKETKVEYLPRVGDGRAPEWLLYSGYWGRQNIGGDCGESSGPRGPMFLDTYRTLIHGSSAGAGERWLDPWSWSSSFEMITQPPK